MQAVLARFRLSAMGECPDGKKVPTSLTIQLSKFYSLCEGRTLIMYAYDLLLQQGDLYFSLGCPLAVHTFHSMGSMNKESVRRKSQTDKEVVVCKYR